MPNSFTNAWFWMLEVIAVPERPRGEREANIMACLLLPGRITVIINSNIWYSNHKTLKV